MQVFVCISFIYQCLTSYHLAISLFNLLCVFDLLIVLLCLCVYQLYVCSSLPFILPFSCLYILYSQSFVISQLLYLHYINSLSICCSFSLSPFLHAASLPHSIFLLYLRPVFLFLSFSVWSLSIMSDRLCIHELTASSSFSSTFLSRSLSLVFISNSFSRSPFYGLASPRC